MTGNLMVLLAALMMAFSCTITEGVCGDRTAADYTSKMSIAALTASVACTLAFEIDDIMKAPW